MPQPLDFRYRGISAEDLQMTLWKIEAYGEALDKAIRFQRQYNQTKS